MPRAIVVGAGPGGALAALVLAKRGFEVDVFEARSEPDPASQEPARSYALIVNRRGTAALGAAGIDLAPHRTVPFAGVTVQAGKAAPEVSILSFDSMTMFEGRAALQRYIIDEARRAAPKTLRFHFGQSLARLDVASRAAQFETASSSGSGSGAAASDGQQTHRYDLLVGADGVNSRVRAELGAQVPGFRFSVQDLGSQYKCFHRIPNDGIAPVPEGQPHSTLVRMCRVKTAQGDPVTFLVLRRNADTTVSGAICFRADIAAKYSSEADWEGALADVQMSDAARRAAAKQLAAVPWAAAGARVRCSTLAGPAELLIGDAAHAVSSGLGEGVNSALEDAVVLDAAAAVAGGNAAAVPAQFNSLRHAETRALVDLDERQWAAMGLLGAWHPLRLEQLNHRWLRSKLQTWFNADAPLIASITRDAPRYTDVLGQMRLDAAITLSAAAVATGGLALAARLALHKLRG